MKQYMVDQLRESDFDKLEDQLNRHAEAGDLAGIYWIPLPESLLGEVQKEHGGCQPFYFAVNLNRQAISFELLIRTRKRLRCNCIHYADKDQREYILTYADELFERLMLIT